MIDILESFRPIAKEYQMFIYGLKTSSCTVDDIPTLVAIISDLEKARSQLDGPGRLDLASDKTSLKINA